MRRMLGVQRCFAGIDAGILLQLSCWALLASIALGPRAARAGTATSPFDIEGGREAAIIGTSAAAIALPLFFGDLPPTLCPCDRRSVNSLDRAVAGWNSSAADRASDIAAVVMLLAPFALDAADLRHDANAGRTFRDDAIVMLESVAVAEGITHIAKMFVHRPRPFLYGLSAERAEIHEADNYRSFFSGHTSGAFAAGISYASTHALRYPGRSDRWLVYTSAAVGGTIVGALRVAAGRHFPTDVVAGALVGTAAGIILPRVH